MHFIIELRESSAEAQAAAAALHLEETCTSLAETWLRKPLCDGLIKPFLTHYKEVAHVAAHIAPADVGAAIEGGAPIDTAQHGDVLFKALATGGNGSEERPIRVVLTMPYRLMVTRHEGAERRLPAVPTQADAWPEVPDAPAARRSGASRASVTASSPDPQFTVDIQDGTNVIQLQALVS